MAFRYHFGLAQGFQICEQKVLRPCDLLFPTPLRELFYWEMVMDDIGTSWKQGGPGPLFRDLGWRGGVEPEGLNFFNFLHTVPIF